MNEHRAIKIAKIDIQRVLASLELAPGQDDDHQLKLDMLEGETELLEVIRALLNANENDEGVILSLDGQIADRKTRKERAEARIESRKKAISALMDCAQETSLKLPEATLSLRTLQPRPKVVSPDELPDAFLTEVVTVKANMEAIKEAMERGETIPGVVMTNGAASLTIRRK